MTDAPDKTSLLLAAKTSGLDVRSRDGDKLGHVDTLMVDKRSGVTSYAVLSLGGFSASVRATIPSRSRCSPTTCPTISMS